MNTIEGIGAASSMQRGAFVTLCRGRYTSAQNRVRWRNFKSTHGQIEFHRLLLRAAHRNIRTGSLYPFVQKAQGRISDAAEEAVVYADADHARTVFGFRAVHFPPVKTLDSACDLPRGKKCVDWRWSAGVSCGGNVPAMEVESSAPT